MISACVYMAGIGIGFMLALVGVAYITDKED